MGYFNANSLGQITSITTNIMESLENIATRVVMLVCDGLLTTSLIVVMLFSSTGESPVCCSAVFAVSFANSRLRIASEKVSGKKIRADERPVEKVLEYLQGMTEVKAYRLTGVKSKELNEAISENSKINIDMEMTLVPRIALQSFIAKLTGVAMVAFHAHFIVPEAWTP